MTVAAEIASRRTRNEKVKALFLSKPYKWISVKELAKVAGFASWRTRVSETRIELRELGADIQWNQDSKDSRYRYLPQRPLGPDAAVPRQKGLF